MPVAEARGILGKEFIIGGTANTFDDVKMHYKAGADYIGCGPFRFTTTKKDLSPVLGLEGYRSIILQMKEANIHLPIVAIGGITLEDIPSIMETGITGIAQLHQLRGRVGRGSTQSYCILISDSESRVAKKRNEIMCQTTDGFVIAEEDLKLRGPGELFGTRQHGLPELNISDLVRNAEILETTKNIAVELIERDPELSSPENSGLKERVRKMFGDKIQLRL